MGGRGLIGLYRSNFSEKWSNGDPVTFSNLAGDCGTSSCCAAMKPDGSWESLHCTTLNYHLILESKTWYEAQRYCRGRYTDLVSIRDQQQNEEVKIKGLNSSTSFWIGLLRDDWQWTDGGNSAYRNWMVGSIHVSAEALSWQEALGYCNEGNRAGILNIDSKAEQEEVESELMRRRVPPGSLWVGLGLNRLSERQTGPGPSDCTADTHTAEAAPDYGMDSDKLQIVCKVK
ncbi:uncharacterized protein LOC128513412 [Clarias gariepinus]|uniref:uncharacterized protein LOC128513412 n=1 Tax=Clarias gariepinus TaxID=13013 RepID=UPI00234D3B67|nr:uncharacterized protein LOC128513412 [Clarias gariepinus]